MARIYGSLLAAVMLGVVTARYVPRDVVDRGLSWLKPPLAAAQEPSWPPAEMRSAAPEYRGSGVPADSGAPLGGVRPTTWPGSQPPSAPPSGPLSAPPPASAFQAYPPQPTAPMPVQTPSGPSPQYPPQYSPAYNAPAAASSAPTAPAFGDPQQGFNYPPSGQRPLAPGQPPAVGGGPVRGPIDPRAAVFADASAGQPAPPSNGAPFAAQRPNMSLATQAAQNQLTGPMIIARVGAEVILASEVAPPVDAAIAERIAAMPEEARARIPEAEIEETRRRYIKQALEPAIEAKLILVDARRSIPEEGLPQVLERMEEEFDTVELPKMLERAGVAKRAELDNKLREAGTSLERERRKYVEKLLARSWVGQNLDFDKPITHQQMLDYYEAHKAEYEYPAQVRYEQLVVFVKNFRSRDEARNALAQMGNRVMIQGEKLADVARSSSQGLNAEEGGLFDWTTKGSLASRGVDQALFELPVGYLSPIIEDDKQMCIVRVLERRDAGRRPFAEMQDEIKDKLKEEANDAQIKEYLAKLRREIRVWTIFDEEAASNPPAEPATGQRMVENRSPYAR